MSFAAPTGLSPTRKRAPKQQQRVLLNVGGVGFGADVMQSAERGAEVPRAVPVEAPPPPRQQPAQQESSKPRLRINANLQRHDPFSPKRAVINDPLPMNPRRSPSKKSPVASQMPASLDAADIRAAARAQVAMSHNRGVMNHRENPLVARLASLGPSSPVKSSASSEPHTGAVQTLSDDSATGLPTNKMRNARVRAEKRHARKAKKAARRRAKARKAEAEERAKRAAALNHAPSKYDDADLRVFDTFIPAPVVGKSLSLKLMEQLQGMEEGSPGSSEGTRSGTRSGNSAGGGGASNASSPKSADVDVGALGAALENLDFGMPVPPSGIPSRFHVAEMSPLPPGLTSTDPSAFRPTFDEATQQWSTPTFPSSKPATRDDAVHLTGVINAMLDEVRGGRGCRLLAR